MQNRNRVAVVGSGCSGLAALWALKSTNHEVHLYESSHRLGGHTNTVVFDHNGLKTNVDSGFIVMNSATYPNFIAFLNEVKVPAVPTEMTFGVSRDQGAFEWAGTSLSAVFAQRENLFRPRVWRMLFDIIRFNQFALDLLSDTVESQNDPSQGSSESKGHRSQHDPSESIGSYLERNGYSEAFKNDYLIPMTAAVWSTSPDKCSLDFPAITLIRFLWNHHLLSTISARPTWMTIKEGSQLYIDAIMKGHPKDQVHMKCAITSLKNLPDGRVEIHTSKGDVETFDHVILATHGDQVLEIIQLTATKEERAIMSNFRTSENSVFLHSDLSLMPRRRIAWSSWNYITKTSGSEDVDQVCLTYWMNHLQYIPTEKFGHILVTLNPLHTPDPKTIQGQWTYHHPLYNAAAIRAQESLPRIQNTRNISYAGAWTKYGFHEDGFSSGLKVAIDHLGAKIPFEFVDSTFSRGRQPVLTWQDYLVRIVIYTIHIVMVLWSLVTGQGRDWQTQARQKAKRTKVL